MYATLKTQSEMGEELFQDVFIVMDDALEITNVLTFDDEGNRIETVATLDYLSDKDDYGVEYEFDVNKKLTVEEGEQLMDALNQVLKYDYELDLPIDKDSYNES